MQGISDSLHDQIFQFLSHNKIVIINSPIMLHSDYCDWPKWMPWSDGIEEMKKDTKILKYRKKWKNGK